MGGTEHAYGHDLSQENVEDLRADLLSALGELVSCEVTLNGEVVEGEQCRGEVTVDGAPLPCDDPDGWHLKDASTIELTGEACQLVKSNPEAVIDADFPCGVILI